VQFKFAPAEHVEYFRPLGWAPAEYLELAVEAKRLDRLEIPLFAQWMWRLMAALRPGLREEMRHFSGIAAFDKA